MYKSYFKNISISEKYYNEIVEYGSNVLESEVFKKAMQQKHHYKAVLGEHILLVTQKALYYCDCIEQHGFHVERRCVTIGALCHDLGMVGREQKYCNKMQCCHQHPIDSVEIASALYPELDEKTRSVIRHHMWPLTLHPPGTLEELCVIKADKDVSFHEVFTRK